MINSIAVYCGSSKGSDPIFSEQATLLADYFIEHEITLINGGGSVGLMGVMGNRMINRGGKCIGIIPKFMMPWEVGLKEMDQLIIVEDMHQRKNKLQELSDAFIALPGSLGTLEELFEVLCWSQLKLHQKPIGLLNTKAYYNPLLKMLNNMVEEGFMKENNRNLLVVDSEINGLMKKLKAYTPNVETKWVP
ncbi:MAG: TIGR00730 family Rossman fold protein [Bacteroidota bacterium]